MNDLILWIANSVHMIDEIARNNFQSRLFLCDLKLNRRRLNLIFNLVGKMTSACGTLKFRLIFTCLFWVFFAVEKKNWVSRKRQEFQWLIYLFDHLFRIGMRSRKTDRIPYVCFIFGVIKGRRQREKIAEKIYVRTRIGDDMHSILYGNKFPPFEMTTYKYHTLSDIHGDKIKFLHLPWSISMLRRFICSRYFHEMKATEKYKFTNNKEIEKRQEILIFFVIFHFLFNKKLKFFKWFFSFQIYNVSVYCTLCNKFKRFLR